MTIGFIFMEMALDNVRQLALDVLDAQPFTKHMGAKLDVIETGYIELSLELTQVHCQHHGFVHGGVLSFMADTALTFAGGSSLGNVVTSEYKINYLKPAIGKKLLAKASVVSSGRTQAVCECKIYCENDTEEKLVCLAQGTIVHVQPKSS